ncbi:hypothetical protein P43SY_009965 [Pythium insidiosum]|uniref:Histone-lysine N-methyltransferase, H3 lysine-79 specific n=1 Tax=Pythium insidiosum TaxID=114742 RepID=A0AAD5LUX3_PYTIN|nr:hypothetical protein ATCC90586_011848 [Pythium insidiosum]KAJ0393346.1 hypothetical protein P43SY_009965 [Pythium insidiosum]
MSYFTHQEDRRITEYALSFMGKRVPWRKLATTMKTGKTAEQLRLRLMSLKRRFGPTPTDVFVDVGSGIGNVVAQVAIETDVAASIGIEVRKDVAGLGKSRMDAFIDLTAALGAVIIHDADIKEMRFEIEP